MTNFVVPFVGSNDTSLSLVDNFKVLILEMKKTHDRGVAGPAAHNRAELSCTNCDGAHTPNGWTQCPSAWMNVLQ